MKVEERRFHAAQVRTDAANGTKKILAGLAARFNSLSEDLGGFRERLAPGCFARSLRGSRDIRMLADHDSSKILGSRSNGTLSLNESATGLHFRCELPNTTVASDVFELCSRGDLKECSFGFTCDDEDWDDELLPGDERKTAVRTVRAANLIEISAVTFPAYANNATHVGAELVGRALFPGGAIPLEIRSRFPGIELGPEETALRSRAATFLTRLLLQKMD